MSASGGRPSARCALVINAGGDGLAAANTLRRGGEQVLPLEKKRKPGDGCTVEWERRCCFTRPLKACAEEAQAKSGETGQVVGYACDWSRVREFLPLALGIASVLLLAVDVRNTLDLFWCRYRKASSP